MQRNKMGQTTLFIILGILIVAAIVLVLLLRTSTDSSQGISAALEAPYTAFLSCLEDELALGVDLMGQQGGYLELPAFEPGSTYSPFSNRLNFVGTQIPYWYYVSGNGLSKTQVPTRPMMEEQLEQYMENRVEGCARFDDALVRIEVGPSDAEATIEDDFVFLQVNSDITLSRGTDVYRATRHEVELSSSFGALYDDALMVYEKEQEELFLEGYGVDALWSYAPVDGVEMTCSPLQWNAEEVFAGLASAIETNTLALRTEGSGEDYFLVDSGTTHEVRFIQSTQWPNMFSLPAEDDPLLLAEPTGNQPGLGILGFCYADYHFVYDMQYPVLVQVFDDDEVFQFPVAVVIRGNQPREAFSDTTYQTTLPDLCEYANTPTRVTTTDIAGQPVDAKVYFSCSLTRCNLGATTEGEAVFDFPQCVNGELSVKAAGYVDTEVLYSSNEEGEITVYLDRLHPLNVDLLVGGRDYAQEAVIHFISDKHTATLVYPEQDVVELTQGEYDISVYVYDDAAFDIPGTTYEECVEVPRGGIGGIIGLTREECYTIDIPSQTIERALRGGGVQSYYFTENELANSRTIELSVGTLPEPTKIEDLQLNHLLLEEKGVVVDLS